MLKNNVSLQIDCFNLYLYCNKKLGAKEGEILCIKKGLLRLDVGSAIS